MLLKFFILFRREENKHEFWHQSRPERGTQLFQGWMTMHNEQQWH